MNPGSHLGTLLRLLALALCLALFLHLLALLVA